MLWLSKPINSNFSAAELHLSRSLFLPFDELPIVLNKSISLARLNYSLALEMMRKGFVNNRINLNVCE